jgi:hypothetical protein
MKYVRWSPTSEVGQKAKSPPMRVTSASPSTTDILGHAQHVRYGSRLCENARKPDCDRTSWSFKTVSSARIANPFNFEVELKNILLVALQDFEFSHSLDPKRTSDAWSLGPKSRTLGGGIWRV